MRDGFSIGERYKDMTVFYKDFSWNKDDLLACSNAVVTLLTNGVSVNDVLALDANGDFGSLDTASVLDDYFGC